MFHLARSRRNAAKSETNQAVYNKAFMDYTTPGVFVWCICRIISSYVFVLGNFHGAIKAAFVADLKAGDTLQWDARLV